MVSSEMLIVLEGLRSLDQDALDSMCKVTPCSGMSCHDCPVGNPVNMGHFVYKTLEENGHD